MVDGESDTAMVSDGSVFYPTILPQLPETKIVRVPQVFARVDPLGFESSGYRHQPPNTEKGGANNLDGKERRENKKKKGTQSSIPNQKRGHPFRMGYIGSSSSTSKGHL